MNGISQSGGRLARFTSRIADLGPALTLGDVSRALPPGLVPTTALLVPPRCCPLDFSPYCPPPHHKAGAAPPLGSGAHDDDDVDLEEKQPPVSGRCPRNPPLTILPTASCRCAHQSEPRLMCVGRNEPNVLYRLRQSSRPSKAQTESV